MAKRGGTGAVRDCRILFGVGSTGGMTDRELLERFVLDQSEGGALAFETLVQRHGTMVLRTCRKVLRDPNDADDAFQATFLVLARKADALWVSGTIGPWLHGVAYRIAARILSDRARRTRHEQHVGALASHTVLAQEPSDDLEQILHAELERLSERFRSPIVLCHLEGLTHDQAALQLGWPVGTVRSRLARGRERLRRALGRRGIALPSTLPLFQSLAPDSAPGRVLVEAAVRSATWTALGNHAPAEVGPTVASLSKGVLTTMTLHNLAKLAAGLLLSVLVAGGAVAYASRDVSPAASPPNTQPTTAPDFGRRPPAPRRSIAERLAERILRSGALRFNAKDAAWLAATYLENGAIRLMGKEGATQREELKQGRAAIESFYRGFFQGVGDVESENTVEFAQFVTPETLIIHGRFRPDRGARDIPFVQLRRRQDDEWRIDTLWLFLQPDDR